MALVPAFIRNHKKTTIAAVVVLLLVVIGIAQGSKAKPPDYVTEVSKKGEIRQTVEAVGTITSERELELRFGGAGIVSEVLVTEGQRVHAGQRLAQLRGGSLGASVASMQASLQSALADLRALEEGNRPEDIAIAEADVQSKRASLQVAQSTVKSADENLKTAKAQLDSLKQETNVNLAGQVSAAASSVNEQLVAAESALAVIDDVLSRVDVSDAIFKNNPGADNQVRSMKTTAVSSIASARTAVASVTDYQSALRALDASRTAVTSAGSAIDNLFFLISSLQETSNFTPAAREGYKTSISAQRSKVQSAGTTLSTMQSTLQNAVASYDSKIVAQQSTITSLQGTRDRAQADILTYQAAIQSSEAQLALKKAGTRQADLDAARARVRAAQANLARSAADYGDTVLTAPVEGVITHVNIRIGEGLPAEAPITMLGDSPFRVEMYVSEIDVPKLAITQSGSIELDAFRGTHMKLRLSDVDSSPTLKDGVSKYRVVLDFQHPHPELRIGMTGDAEIVTGIRQDVVSVARRAVLEETDGSLYVRVIASDGKTVVKKPVILGMEGGTGEVEIMSGLNEGETVIDLEKK